MSIKFIWCIIIIILFFFFLKDLFSYGRVHYSDIMRRFICLRSESNEGQTILEFGGPIELVLNITASNSSHCINFCVYSLPNVESLKWHCLSSKNRTTRIRGRRCSGFFFQGVRDKMFWIDGSPSGGRRGNCATRGARLWHQQFRFSYEQLPRDAECASSVGFICGHN